MGVPVLSTAVVLLVLFLTVLGLAGAGVVGNVALYQKCSMSSYHAQMKSGTCRQVVNGDTGGSYPGANNCIHTAIADPNPWFEVDLGRPYPIVYMVLMARENHKGRMANCRILVDGVECYRFPKDTKSMQREMFVNCTRALNGRVVRISKEVVGKADGDQTLNLCELQVFSCVANRWGSACNQPCGQCDEVDGEAFKGCDKVTGHCERCAPGMKPPFCLYPSANSTDLLVRGSGERFGASYCLTGALVATTISMILLA